MDLKIDFKEAVGPIQVCAGHQAGAEAAIHAMQTIFQEENTEGVLLIDASNAFNSMSRAVTLHNIQIICPRASVTLINTYRNPAQLFIAGGGAGYFPEKEPHRETHWLCHFMQCLHQF